MSHLHVVLSLYRKYCLDVIDIAIRIKIMIATRDEFHFKIAAIRMCADLGYEDTKTYDDHNDSDEAPPHPHENHYLNRLEYNIGITGIHDKVSSVPFSINTTSLLRDSGDL